MSRRCPSPTAIPILLPETQEPCAELKALLEVGYEDPISEAYGIGDMSEVIIRSHVRRCVTCRRA